MVYGAIGGVSWKSGDQHAAAISFDKALGLIDALPRDEQYAEDPRDLDRASIANVQAQAGDVKGARQTLALIKDESSRSGGLFDIALAEAHTGNFDDAVRTASAVQDASQRDQLLMMIANQQARIGDLQSATKLAHSIKTAAFRAEALAHIATVHTERGQVDEAADESQEAVRTASGSEEDVGRSSLDACSSQDPEEPRDSALQRVAELQAGSGDISASLETLSHVNRVANRENVLAEIAEAQAQLGDLGGAQARIAAIGRDACKAAALNGVARALFERDDLPGALTVVATISVPNERVMILTYFGEELVKQRQFNSALQIVRRALHDSKLIADASEKASSILGIAKVQAHIGSLSEAAQTLSEAAPLARADYERARENHGWSSLFPEFIGLEVEVGELERAKASLDYLEDSDRALVAQNAALECTKAGDANRAIAWTTLQLSPRDRAFAILGVAEGILIRRKTSTP